MYMKHMTGHAKSDRRKMWMEITDNQNEKINGFSRKHYTEKEKRHHREHVCD